MTIKCPYCEAIGPFEGFNVSCAGECFCPMCKREFLIDGDEDEEEDDDD